MKCEDLKELLNSSDEKNARIKANTIECFEQVKDFIVDDLIQKSIDSNFREYGSYLRGHEIYGKLFEIKEMSTEFIFNMYLYGFGWEDYYRITDPSVFGELDQDQQAEYTKNRLAIKTFFPEFDRDLFKHLVENHVKENGFKKVRAKSFSGVTFETERFYASRSTIEKACCPDTKPSQVKGHEQKGGSVIFAAVIMVMVLIAMLILIYGGY